ncbi:MAG: colanic acid biosynthesis glycosyltransferase WcaI [Chloroflexi bacterium]|nr:MAG: colanic acid biosynthesis glycosyltransferase WcaI [Chloroflexota bacterium]
MSRILIVGLNFHPEPIGIGKYTAELSAYLAEQGHDVHVITTHPYYPHWRVAPGYPAWKYKKETWRQVEVRRCPLWVPRRPTGFTRLIHLATFALSSLPALVAQFRWKPDLVLCIAPALMNAPFALAFARLSGAKAWLHIQDFELDAALKLGLLPGRKWLAGLVKRLERLLLMGFDKVSSISERMLKHLVEKGMPQGKILLFPNWVDTGQIYPLLEGPNPLRATLGLAPEQLAVLYAGTMGKKQGLEHLLTTASRLREQCQLQFILCGDGAVRAELENTARGLSNVIFLQVQPVERLNELLNLADIHILSQKADAADLVMPSKLGGMLASGKAVIATAHPNTEVGQVMSQVGEMVPPEDPATLAEAIVGLANDPLKRSRLGRLGREYACRHLEKETVLANFNGALEALISDQRVYGT